MGARELLADLTAAGIAVEVTERGLIASPKAALTDDLRTRIRDERDGLIAEIRTDSRSRAALVEAINRCCDARGDDEANRRGLIAECGALPATGLEDMREHFEAEARRWERPLSATTRSAP